jgi:hypothetical protein
VSKVWIINLNLRYQILVTRSNTTKAHATQMVKKAYPFDKFEIEEAKLGAYALRSVLKDLTKSAELDKWFSPQQPRGNWVEGKMPYTGRTLMPGEEIE